MRNLTWLDYNSGGKEIVKEYEDCELAIIMFLLEGEYSFIKIFPVWKDEERITPSIKIPYLSWNKGLLMSEFIEPFLVALSQFLTEEERGKLPPPGVRGKRKRKRKGRGNSPFRIRYETLCNNWRCPHTGLPMDKTASASR